MSGGSTSEKSGMDFRNCSSWGFDAVNDATFGYSHSAPTTMNRLFLVAALVVALPLAAAPKLVVLPFEGKKANAGRSQLVSDLCKQFDCIPDARIGKKGKVDWAKVKKEKVTHVLGGVKAGKNTTLTLQTADKKTALKQGYLTGPNGRFFPGPLKDAISDVARAIGKGGSPATEVEDEEEEEEETPAVAKKETPPAEEEEEEEEEVEEPPPAKKAEVAQREVKPQEEDLAEREETPAKKEVVEEEEEEDESEEEAPGGARPPLFIGQLGFDAGPRIYSYSDVGTRNLRAYRALFIFQPRVHAEVYPLARILTGIPAGLGIEGDYSLAVGLKSGSTGGPTYPTRLSRLDLALRLRMTPVADSKLVINPLFGFRTQSFSTLPGEDGSRLEGLADISYTALRIGATVEQPILDDNAAVIGELAVLPLLGTGPLEQFFPENGGFGFELGAAFAYTVFPRAQVKLGATVTRYGLGFTTAETDTYVASGASDLFVNGNVGLRYTY